MKPHIIIIRLFYSPAPRGPTPHQLSFAVLFSGPLIQKLLEKAAFNGLILLLLLLLIFYLTPLLPIPSLSTNYQYLNPPPSSSFSQSTYPSVPTYTISNTFIHSPPITPSLCLETLHPPSYHTSLPENYTEPTLKIWHI